MLKKAHVIKPPSKIIGDRMKVEDEWEGGYLLPWSAPRQVKVAAKKGAEDEWIVYYVAYEGGEERSTRTLYTSKCETCAKVFARQLVFGKGYSFCPKHRSSEIEDAALFNGTVALLLAAVGIENWDALDEDLKDVISWIARQLMNGKIEWEKVVTDLEEAEKQGLPINEAIRGWGKGKLLEQTV